MGGVNERTERSMEQKTALVLGGGGARGAYEIGVWKAIREQKIPIHMVTGTSVGSINGAIVAQDEYDLAESLWKELDTEMVLDIHPRVKSQDPEGDSLKTGGMKPEEALLYLKEIFVHKGVGTQGLYQLLHQYLDEKKVRSSSILYGLVTAKMPNLKEKQILEGVRLFIDQIPEGKLIHFIMASSSFFPAMQAYEIDGIAYIDGGYVEQVPVSMALERGATRVIAVELNPENPFHKKKYDEVADLTWIRSFWDLGSILVFDRKNTKRLMQLGYLDARKALGLNQGQYFTFERGIFSKEVLEQADSAAKVFELDPFLIYSKEGLEKALREEIQKMKRKKWSREVSGRMLVLATAEKIMQLPKETREAVKEYKGIVLQEEKGAIKYLLNHIL